jgi:RNA polymerase sigma-70 factor (ECF subfamily)
VYESDQINPWSSLSEKELILGCKNKDSKYQKALFDKYSGILFTICRRYFPDNSLAEDALQEGFIRIYRKIDQYKFEGSFEGWMKRVMVNICLRKIQKEARQYDWNALDDQRSTGILPEIESKLFEEELLQLLELLPEGYRTVFNLYALDGFSHREIAEKLGITDSTSRSQLVKARKMLQKFLKERYDRKDR